MSRFVRSSSWVSVRCSSSETLWRLGVKHDSLVSAHGEARSCSLTLLRSMLISTRTRSHFVNHFWFLAHAVLRLTLSRVITSLITTRSRSRRDKLLLSRSPLRSNSKSMCQINKFYLPPSRRFKFCHSKGVLGVIGCTSRTLGEHSEFAITLALADRIVGWALMNLSEPWVRVVVVSLRNTYSGFGS